MLRLRHLLVLGALGACRFDGSGGSDTLTHDAGPSSDAAADGAVASVPGHLLLSEIVAVKGSQVAAEFIEIWNPGPDPVELETYYLSDAPDYYQLPDAVAKGTALPVDGISDFLARFPDGATLGVGALAVVALDQGEFASIYDAPPDYATQPGDAPALEVLYGGTTPTITDTGEGVILFQWDAASDRVTDVDQVIVGKAPSGANRLPDKSGALIDGPDADTTPTQYLDEAATIIPTQTTTLAGEAYERIGLESGHERDTGGNGLGGHDETSENTRVTWRQVGFAAPSPGTLSVELSIYE